MGKRRKPMIDTYSVEEDEEVGPSRTKLRAERKEGQARREALAMLLAKMKESVVRSLDLGEEVEKEVRVLARLRPGSALARQRRRVAGTLRPLDLDEIEPRIRAAIEEQKR